MFMKVAGVGGTRCTTGRFSASHSLYYSAERDSLPIKPIWVRRILADCLPAGGDGPMTWPALFLPPLGLSAWHEQALKHQARPAFALAHLQPWNFPLPRRPYYSQLSPIPRAHYFLPILLPETFIHESSIPLPTWIASPSPSASNAERTCLLTINHNNTYILTGNSKDNPCRCKIVGPTLGFVVTVGMAVCPRRPSNVL